MSNDLTSDNPYLSRPTIGPFTNGPTSSLPEQVAGYVTDSLATNTRRAYLSDLAHFESWAGFIPASDTLVASYLAAHTGTLSVATLVRRLASISKAHEARGLPNPTQSGLVRAAMRGIKRTRGTAQHEAKPLLRDDLMLVLDAMGNGFKDMRDQALLLIGFAGDPHSGRRTWPQLSLRRIEKILQTCAAGSRTDRKRNSSAADFTWRGRASMNLYVR